MKSNTVLILGAGASVDYGFPTGLELSEKIAITGNHSGFLKDFLMLCPTHSRHIYQRGFDLIDRNFFRSRSLSIDSWLAKEENSECVDAAKLLIARVISIREKSDFSTSQNGFLRLQHSKENPKPDWYQRLFNALSTPNKFEDFPSSNDKLTIVTFNYDRSLEFYFLEAMQGMYPEHSKDDCWEKLNLLNIKHVYGSVGDLPVAYPSHPVEYGSEFPEDYMDRIKNLNLIPELRNNNETISFIQGKLKEAQNIFFVGFSYDLMNLELLGFPFQSNQSNVLDFSGSVYGMEDGEIQKVGNIIHISTNHGTTKLNPVDADAYTFFRKIITKSFSL